MPCAPVKVQARRDLDDPLNWQAIWPIDHANDLKGPCVPMVAPGLRAHATLDQIDARDGIVRPGQPAEPVKAATTEDIHAKMRVPVKAMLDLAFGPH